MFFFVKNKSKFMSLFLLSLLIVFVFLSPHIYALLITPKGSVFLQASWFDPWDITVYVSAIKWAQEFGFTFQNAYTTTPHKSVILYPLYTFLGMLFRQTNPWIIFYSTKIILGIVSCFLIYKSSKIFLKDHIRSLTALFFICFAGGLGWATSIFYLSPDTSVTPFILSSSFEKPHAILATGIYLLSLSYLFKGIGKDKKDLVTSGLLILAVMLFYPYYLLSYYLIAGIYSLIHYQRRVKSIFATVAMLFFLTFPLGLVHSLYIRSSQAFLKNVLSPFLDTPNPFSLVLGYGILGFIFVYQLFHQKKKEQKFLSVFFVISIFLAISPLPFSRYYLRGLFFPLVLIGLIVLSKISTRYKIKKYRLIKIVGFFLILSNVFILLGRFANINLSSWTYLEKEDKEAVLFIKKNIEAGQGFLVDDFTLANELPSFVPQRVFYGHTFQTPDSQEKALQQNKFFEGKMGQREAKEFLQKNKISYIYKKKTDSEISYTFVKPIYTNKQVKIYTF